MKSTRHLESGLKQKVFSRDNYTCRYCGDKRGPFHLDHVYPYVKGGETSAENLVTACAGCNQHKHARVGEWPKPIGYFERKLHINFYLIAGISDLLLAFVILFRGFVEFGWVALGIGVLMLLFGAIDYYHGGSNETQ